MTDRASLRRRLVIVVGLVAAVVGGGIVLTSAGSGRPFDSREWQAGGRARWGMLADLQRRLEGGDMSVQQLYRELGSPILSGEAERSFVARALRNREVSYIVGSEPFSFQSGNMYLIVHVSEDGRVIGSKITGE